MTRKRGGRNRNRDAQMSIYDSFAPSVPRDRKALIERMYIRVLTELSCNRFKWSGLPAEVDVRFLELTLFRNSLCVFFQDVGMETSTDRFFALRGTGAGAINMYDNPTKFRVLGNSMIDRTLESHECVPIWSNYLRQPDWDIVSIYASKLAEIDRTIEINIDSARLTYLIFASENQRLSMQNIMRQHKEGVPVIFATDAMDPGNIQSFPVSVEKDMILNLQLSKAKLWNECMTLLGINNANQDKKERLIAGEVDANNGQVMASRGISINARTLACEQINAMFPHLDVSVEWNDGVADSVVQSGVSELKVY